MSRRAFGIGVAVLATAVAAVTLRAEEKPAPAVHPVDRGDAASCLSCHEETTPAVYTDWYDGEHGLNNVKCFVCHGSVGDDFKPIPATESCVACHADQVASMARPTLKGKTCFDCHSSHRLDPHGM